jgi:serine/threonine-protein kinase
LKLPRLAWVPDLAARVASERDILVSLEHPNIARLYDAGVDDQGRPFLAIEYVEGQRIDVYCDEKRLNVRERVTLFKQIVDAVQYAHTQLVIHRDLKPANVLVNSRGKAILLDFGIASLLAEAQGADADPVLLTVSRAMTPRFASPEQLQGVRLSLTSDVYSLGVMMYDLLVGSTPYRTQNPTRSEFERAVIEGDIRAPSESEITVDIAARRSVTPERLARQLGGDLDAIVRKAMQLNPQARYPSVEAMAADLERWLTGHPVLAAPPSRLNRCVKFTRRNPIRRPRCRCQRTDHPLDGDRGNAVCSGQNRVASSKRYQRLPARNVRLRKSRTAWRPRYHRARTASRGREAHRQHVTRSA